MTYRSRAGALGRVRGRLAHAGIVLLALLAFAVLGVDRAHGASVEPVLQEGETVCTDIKPQRKELLVAPPVLGTNAFDDGTLSGSYTLDAANQLAWASNDLPVDYVLVHTAGGGTSYYQYPGDTTADSGLAAPNGDAIDAVRFCYDNQNRGRVRIVKRTVPSGSGQLFSFHPSADLAPADFGLGDGDTAEFRPKPGTYTVTEAATDGWQLDAISCDDANSTAAGATATVVVDPGETVTCTFTNAALAPPVVVKPDPAPLVRVAPPVPMPLAATPMPRFVVQAASARGASARLRRPLSCVSRAYRVTLTGAPVRRIELTVNGRRVRTVIARGGQRTFTVRLPLAKGTVQRVAARVVFRNGARPRTLRTTVLRCARAVRPQFTG